MRQCNWSLPFCFNFLYLLPSECERLSLFSPFSTNSFLSFCAWRSCFPKIFIWLLLRGYCVSPLFHRALSNLLLSSEPCNLKSLLLRWLVQDTFHLCFPIRTTGVEVSPKTREPLNRSLTSKSYIWLQERKKPAATLIFPFDKISKKWRSSFGF